MAEKGEESFEQWRARIDAQLEAARRGLSGTAIVGSHRSIIARMTRRTNTLVEKHGLQRGIELAGQELDNSER